MDTSKMYSTLLRCRLWTIAIFCLASCSSDKWEVDPNQVDLGREFRVRTFYKDIRNLPEYDSTAIEKLIRVYGEFWGDYSEDILKLGPFNDVATAAELRLFINHESTVETLDAIDTTSGSDAKIAEISLELENGFKRFHALLPSEPVPDVILMTSGFNFAIEREGWQHPAQRLRPHRRPQQATSAQHQASQGCDSWAIIQTCSRVAPASSASAAQPAQRPHATGLFLASL